MCRFLLFKSNKPAEIGPILSSFSRMAEKSRAFDGDRQEDGWGIAWLQNDLWHSYKSVKPIWEEREKFNQFPKSPIFTIHARSASFVQHKNNSEYNQPYINGGYTYVFNGLLKGVSLSLPGDIGAQKIWNLLNSNLRTLNMVEALLQTAQVLKNNSQKIQALNIGIANKHSIAAYSYFTKHPSYYSLHFVDNQFEKIICSEPIEGFDFKILSVNSSLIF